MGGGERDLSTSAWLLAIVSAQKRGDRTGIKLENRIELLVIHDAVLTHDRKAGFDRSPKNVEEIWSPQKTSSSMCRFVDLRIISNKRSISSTLRVSSAGRVILGPSDGLEVTVRRRADLGRIIGRVRLRIARDGMNLDIKKAKSCLGFRNRYLAFEVKGSPRVKFMY